MRIGVIVSGGRVARWQADALRRIAAGNRFVIYDCDGERAKRSVRHALYYALNLAAVRNPMTAPERVPPELEVEERIGFAANPDGAWERIPSDVIERIQARPPDVIVKFGMGLLRVPERLPCPILSYHHGDPRRFRGRPAGFHELLTGEPEMGQIVQILSNRLDAGAVVGFAQTKAHPHSWRQSLIEAYKVSPLLLGPAIERALSGQVLPIDPTGKNYRLPSNATVARLCARLLRRKLQRLAYGGLVEKRWRVGEARLPDDWSVESLSEALGRADWRVPGMPPHYRFFADPFYASDGGILLEAMRADGAAEIVRIAGENLPVLAIGGGHCSYPATLSFDGREFVVPEISDWSPPRLFELDGDSVEDRGELDIPGRPRLLDATLFTRDDACFLFASRRDEGDRILRLWVADHPFARFTEHPQSPIRIAAAGSRMAGGIFERGGQLYRPGQDLRGAYGDGLLLFRIGELSRATYREEQCASVKFAARRGPHTLNIRGNMALFDFYSDRVSLLAGFRRLRQSRAN